MPYARPQPEVGQFWGKIHEYIRGTVPKVRVSYMFVPCQHCNNAPCVDVCLQEAISIREDGLVIIDPSTCSGCQLCLEACPYDVIFFNPALGITQKCTGCAHLIDRGWPIKEPRCSDNCPIEAIVWGEESDLSAKIEKSEILNPEYDLDTRVHYIGIPKKFIAGTVYDPNTKDIIEGATCTLTGDENGSITTDFFGDFWFDGLSVGTYSLKIEANGKTKTFDSISTVTDVNLGDIPLS
jgi:Fe-S-cluster-containing dehydrogenase component